MSTAARGKQRREHGYEHGHEHGYRHEHEHRHVDGRDSGARTEQEDIGGTALAWEQWQAESALCTSPSFAPLRFDGEGSHERSERRRAARLMRRLERRVQPKAALHSELRAIATPRLCPTARLEELKAVEPAAASQPDLRHRCGCGEGAQRRV